MAWLEAPDNHPWCSGRTYPNGHPRTKAFCLRRPPPWWWILTFTGFTNTAEHLNGQHVIPYWRTQDGINGISQWRKVLPAQDPHELTVHWQRHYVADPYTFYIVVTFDLHRNLTQATSWRLGETIPVSSWFQYDDIDMIENTRSPLWNIGEPICNIKIGTYERLPAHSCAGDWRGVWP